jgi:hypothetical protein
MPGYDDPAYNGLTALARTDSVVFLTSAGSREGTVADIKAVATLISFNVQTGTSYTLVLADCNDNKIVATNNASANTVTVPPNVFSEGAQIEILNLGAGITTLVQGSGVVINTTSTLQLAERYARCVLLLTPTANTWVVSGEMAL